MEDFRSISVTSEIVGGKKQLKVRNPAGYPMIGIGAQGAVFRLSSDRCVKVYEDSRTAFWESKALKAAEEVPYFPKLYETGDKYVIMEYLPGPNLRDYLADNPGLTESFAAQLLGIVKAMRKLKFARIDTRTGHIIVTEGGKLKVIDHSGAYRTIRRAPFMLFKSLERDGGLRVFLKYVAEHDPKLYGKWRKKRIEGVDLADIPRLPRPEKLLHRAT
ncbi:serine/threonine protein kinase [Paenibacillus hemerocallicola]|jgi:predicted Ser/Thr protein kinase|uniref:Serine/threonine protein kinase n=1 Tax=Paenibacillus hemerocallicola TaxID=1172614 RepID=A0A5C4TCA9_9BACL|nr:serine/threonine protein kinase [Paenibacillus hemerocallicola]TNJ66575.1 serine/threonine protein kinase [Paenibacillus hemerocallicola]